MSNYPRIPIAQTVVRLSERYGIDRIVICAGSRNAPLTNGFVSQDYFKTYSIVDERAAAFFALGMAQQLKKPVALVCTSGSALLNFYPAIAEAYYSDIPLVVISADRMPHRIDIGDGQTIRQEGVFEPHLETAAILKPDVIHNTAAILENPMQQLLPQNADQSLIEKIQKVHQKHNEQEIARVFLKALKSQGPVHLNIPMEEPLYGMTETLLSIEETPEYNFPTQVLATNFASAKKAWHQASKKWVIIGQMPPDEIDQSLIDVLCADPSVIVFTETTSNITHQKLINSIDSLMAPAELLMHKIDETIRPELLLTFGGMVVSKKIKFFLRKHRPKHHWHIDKKKAYNTYYCLDKHFKVSPQVFLAGLYENANEESSSNFQNQILNYYNGFKNKGQEYLKDLPFSDLSVFRFLAQNIPSDHHLQIANSSSIRYTQLFDWSENTIFYCNRGTSGIDGSTATAIGATQINELPTILITGDLSFFYDINGLWNDTIPENFKIILINNNGGGIFRILPGQKDTPKYDRYFETIHNRDAKYIAKAFGFGYSQSNSFWSLKRKFSRFLKSNKQPQIFEIQTPRKINDGILLNYFKAMGV
jgi:2-succinyl-5-enolpyruvyl-6-hydroxy-3-cyclohexene-1-carboxylate synthase